MDLSGLPLDVLQWRAEHLPNSVNPETAEKYARQAYSVALLGGDYNFKGFLKYCAARDRRFHSGKGRRLTTTTMRQMKSACLHMCHLEGRPWGEDASVEADMILYGRRASDSQTTHRGVLTSERLAKVVAKCEELEQYDIADGLVVMYGACTRVRDIAGMTAEQVDVSGRFPVVLVERKAPDQQKVDRRFDRNPIGTDEALAVVLLKLDTLSPEDLFSGTGVRRSRRKSPSGWPRRRAGKGCTVVHLQRSTRCGATLFGSGLAAAVDRNNWCTTGSAIRYGATTSQEAPRRAEHRTVLKRRADQQRA